MRLNHLFLGKRHRSIRQRACFCCWCYWCQEQRKEGRSKQKTNVERLKETNPGGCTGGKKRTRSSSDGNENKQHPKSAEWRGKEEENREREEETDRESRPSVYIQSGAPSFTALSVSIQPFHRLEQKRGNKNESARPARPGLLDWKMKYMVHSAVWNKMGFLSTRGKSSSTFVSA